MRPRVHPPAPTRPGRIRKAVYARQSCREACNCREAGETRVNPKRGRGRALRRKRRIRFALPTPPESHRPAFGSASRSPDVHSRRQYGGRKGCNEARHSAAPIWRHCPGHSKAVERSLHDLFFSPALHLVEESGLRRRHLRSLLPRERNHRLRMVDRHSACFRRRRLICAGRRIVVHPHSPGPIGEVSAVHQNARSPNNKLLAEDDLFGRLFAYG